MGKREMEKNAMPNKVMFTHSMDEISRAAKRVLSKAAAESDPACRVVPMRRAWEERGETPVFAALRSAETVEHGDDDGEGRAWESAYSGGWMDGWTAMVRTTNTQALLGLSIVLVTPDVTAGVCKFVFVVMFVSHFSTMHLLHP